MTKLTFEILLGPEAKMPVPADENACLDVRGLLNSSRKTMPWRVWTMAAVPTVVSMQALTLYPIQKVKLQFGGYNIKFSGNVPNGAKVRLLIGSYTDSIDISPYYL